MSVVKCPQMLSRPNYFTQFCKKIILSTDQDLIKDGVQAIDEEFLEWFVKNPSCEEVEVIKQELNTDYRSDWKQKFYYKIIIPSEEPKQEKMEFYTKEQLQIAYNCGLSDGKFNNIDYSITDNFAPIEEPKQETLEEDLKFPIIIENGMDYLNLTTKIFNNDAKWQQEQIGKSEFLQKLRATLSDAEARRLIFETFNNK
jgi:hypothetical protein